MSSRTRVAALLVGAVTALALSACGEQAEPTAAQATFDLPVGPTEWDAGAPAWFHDGTLHVGDRTVELGDRVDDFVLGVTGVYWVRGGVLMFTSAEGDTQEVADVGWNNLAVSADRTVLATVDQNRGPTDRYGTHVMQLVVFDTRTGEQLYRTPDETPDAGEDLADLHGEIMPLLDGVSATQAFYADDTIDLADGTLTPTTEDAEGIDVYVGQAQTMFADGYRVGIRARGTNREVDVSSAFGIGRLSPDRSVLFDVGTWPAEAIAYDAATGRPRPIDAPWDHFGLVAFSDEDTFFGVAQSVDVTSATVLQEAQIVSCEVATLACTPVSPVIAPDPYAEYPDFLVEGDNVF